MSSEKSGFHPNQIVPGVLAAVTAAVLGSTLGVAGTILGAAIGSVVSTVAAEFYVRSLERVRVRVGRTEEKTGEEKAPKPSRRVRWQLLAGVSVAVFVLGMVVITGVEWVRGSPLSGEGKTTIGGVLQPPHTSTDKPAVPSSPPPSPRSQDQPPTVTVTTTPPPPSTATGTSPSAPPSTTGSGSSGSSSTTGSSTDPVQSTPTSPPSGSP
ncbi:hypothetical protein ACFQ1S_18195 [Kibdelosporangium lantanae]|uniref:Uncharacterized protein n=1 Tax=Kibdelosporangium lantanae TaxID=1497396 RepID=A0ABW3MB38_9PSEU